MIPPIIHYCWFGRGPMPELALKCIDSWHKFMPDYDYKLWNEDNFDIKSNLYVSEAYEARKYAFVSDYVRLYALLLEGGIYLDTDVEVLKSMDDLRHFDGFIGYEGTKYHPIGTGTIASKARGEWVKQQIKEYDDIHFILADSTYDTTTNPVRITNVMKGNGFQPNGREQDYLDMHIFPVDYFCPRQTTGEYLITKNTYCDHHFMGTWDDKEKSSLSKWIGRRNLTRLIKLKRKILG